MSQDEKPGERLIRICGEYDREYNGDDIVELMDQVARAFLKSYGVKVP